MNRFVAVALSACALCAVVPSAAPAAGPPETQWVFDCFLYGGPAPENPLDPWVGAARCIINHY